MNLLTALAHSELGDHQSAIPLLQKVMLQCDNPYAQGAIRLALAQQLQHAGDSQTSTAILRQGLAHRNVPPEIRLALTYVLGSQCLQTGKYKDAVKLLSDVAARQYDYLRVQELLSKANDEAGTKGTKPAVKQGMVADTSSPSDPRQILGLERNASEEEIKQAYRTLVAQYHPDKTAHLGSEIKALAEEKTETINGAYDLIMKIKSLKT